MTVQQAIESLNYLYLEEAHKLSSYQHEALAVGLIALRAMPEDMKLSVNTVVDGLRFVKPE